MKIAFNPSTVAALTSPPDNKDITFDLRGRNIFARGVKFYGTDTWRPVVDNLTSNSATSSLSANQGRVLAGLINGKSDSDHNHDGRYLKLTGGTLTGNLVGTSAMFSGRFYGNGDDEGIIIKPSSNGYAGLILGTHDGERSIFYFVKNKPFWRYSHGSDNLDIIHPKKSGTIALISDIPNKNSWNYDDRYLKLTGGTMLLGEGLKFHANDNYFGTNADARIISLLDNNDKICDGGLIIDERATLDGKEYVTELLRIRDSEFKWRGADILHSGNYSSILDSRYYTESEVNSLLSKKLDRVNLSVGSWNPRGYNLAADYHYNGGDLSISESKGQIHVSIDGYFWQNEGQYRVLDTSDVAGLKGDLTVHQYLSATDTAWRPLIWGGSSHTNTSDSTGAVYKSHDKLSWQTSSQTLYATHLRTTNLDTQTAIFHPDNDSTLKIYSGRTQDAVSDGHIGLQTSIDNTDGQTHVYPTQYGSRCVLALQPRGGSVYIGNMPNGGNGRKLNVNGDIGLFNTGSIRDLAIGGGIYWNPNVESATDGSDAASITLVKSGVAGGTTLVLSQMNNANDTIQFQTNIAARLYHNSYPILTTQNTYVSNNKGYINGTEITQVNNADKVDNRHAISTIPNTGIIYKAAIYTSSSLTSYWVRLASIPSINQNNEFVATIHVQSGHSNPGRSAILLVYLRGAASSLSKSFKICCNSNYDPNRFRLYYKDSDKTSEIWYQTTGQWDGIITTVISQSSEGSLYEGLTLYSGSITAVQTPSMSTYLSAQVSTITDNISGNASTATKLATPRKIWGQSFDGTADVDNTLRIRQTTGNYCEGIRIQTGDGKWATIILGATADSGTNANAWSIHRKSDNNFAISRNSSDGANGLVMTPTGMGLGTTAPTQRLDVAGNIRTTGNLYISHATNNNMNHDTSNPRIVFSESGSQAVGLVYTDYDSYRASKGLKVMDVDNSDPGNVWFEVQGYNYSSGYVKNGSNDNYVLLGGGGHKAESSLRVAYASNADMVDGYHADNMQSAGWRNLYRTGGSANVIKWTRIGRCISPVGDRADNDGMIEFHTNGDQNYRYFGHGKMQISQYGPSSKSLMLSSVTSENIHFYATIDKDNYIWLGHNAWWSGNSAYRVIWSGSYIEWYSSGMSMQTTNPNSVYITDNGTFKKPQETGSVYLNNIYVEASKLKTARSIWGQSFDGTKDINGTIYINNGNSENGAIILNNNVNTHARISAIGDQVVFNTGSALRFGGTEWEYSDWAGIKYDTVANAIYLGIADGTVFNYYTNKRSNGTLKFPGISNINLDGNARIGHSSGSLYIGNSGNDGWIYTQDIASQLGTSLWNIRQSGAARFGKIHIASKNDESANNNVIESDTGVSLHLNYFNNGNITLCNGGGNVGIGTMSPAYKLDVNGQMRAEGFHHWTVNSDNYMLLAGGGYKSFGGDDSNPIFLGYLNLDHGNDGTISSSFSCLGYSVPFTYTRGGNYCRIYIPDTTHQVFFIGAATASVHYSGGGMDTWTGVHRGSGAWWLHCYAEGTNEVRVKGFCQNNSNNDSWWGGNPLWSGNDGVNRITVCIFGYVKFR